MKTTSELDLGAFMHPALFYNSEQEYLDCLVPFITEGLKVGQPVLVAVPGPNLAALRDALGDAADEVTMADMTEAGRNPGSILGGVLGRFAAQHAPKPVRIIGEPIWSSRSKDEYPACVQHEALINNAFAGWHITVLCPYDATHLDLSVIADARITHPVLWQAGQAEQESAAFAPEAAWAYYNEPLPTNSTAANYTVHELTDLSGVRSFAAAYGRRFGLPSDTVANLQMIGNELATISLQHAGEGCRLAFWQDNGHLICEARDRGHLDDPLAGRRPYRSDTARGRALFVVHALADLVRSHTAPEETTIRAYLRLPEAA